jgi:SagB-type dehydrogenase family enzyme
VAAATAATAGADLWLGAPLARASGGDAVATLLAHHDRTKHRRGRMARAPERVEWGAQPAPFRRFHGAPLLPLDLVPPTPEPTWDALATGRVAPRPPDRSAVSQFLFDSLSLSAWKERGPDRWSLRVNPSSGNLHPVEAYLAGGPFPGLTDAPALLHYAPHEHALELRATLPDAAWRPLAAALPPGGLLVALTTIVWREAWKYGERAWRYTLLDAGHAVAALSIAAAALGWRARIVAGWSDRDVARLTGVDRQTGPEAERPEALLALWPGPRGWDPDLVRALRPAPELATALARLPLAGQPNALGGDPREWAAIEEAVRAAERRGADAPPAGAAPSSPGSFPDRGLAARALVRRRRSATAFAPDATMTAPELLRMLERTRPEGAPPALAAFPWPTSVHLALLVHRVDGLPPGLYVLPRSPAGRGPLEAALGGARRSWEPAEGAGRVPLLRLAATDLREAARAACCDQDTGSDGAFVAAFLAPLEPVLRAEGAWAYRRLHWEAGALCQALYLEAEAAGVRGTAMGCFLDDELHRLLRLAAGRFQVLYTFAAGRPVEDPRLRTAEPYAHRG